MDSERLARQPVTPVCIEGVTLQLTGDFDSLVEAESFFRSEGHQVDLATAIFNARDPDSALSGLRQLLPCALHAHHPELGYWEVQQMINRTVASDNPVLVEAVQRMWPVHHPSSLEIMARFFERLPDEWKEQFRWQVIAERIAERWPGAAQA
jgi:hypothetical protein